MGSIIVEGFMLKLNISRFELLSRDDLYRINNSTLKILEETGVVFKHKNALKIFDEFGAKVDYKTGRVFIPHHLIDEALKKVPKRIVWYARVDEKSMKIEDGIVNFGGMRTPAFIYDLETGFRRRSTKTDFENIVKIMDYLELIDEGYGSVHIGDVPENLSHLYAILIQIKNTGKPIWGRVRGGNVARDCLNMISMVAGGREELMKKPMIACSINPTSPLQWDVKMIEGMMEYVKLNQIVIPSSEVMSGATGPVTLAGTIVQQNAEILSMIVLIQIINPGNPVLYGTVSTAMDMKTANTRTGGPELGIMHIISAQLARMYGIPSRGAAGCTDSKILDVQAGYEAAFNLLLAVLSGFNFITYALGGVESSLSVCYEKILTDYEFLNMIKRLVDGVEVSDDTLAIDLINKVGPGGHFLAQKHTREYHRREHFIPKIFNTQSYDRWFKSEFRDIRDRAREEVKRILKEHEPPPIDKTLEKELMDYLKKMEEAYCK
ncbi:MAG: trimethylamine methyltransferase family protein [Candidatus Methanomethylicia archaeon]